MVKTLKPLNRIGTKLPIYKEQKLIYKEGERIMERINSKKPIRTHIKDINLGTTEKLHFYDYLRKNGNSIGEKVTKEEFETLYDMWRFSV